MPKKKSVAKRFSAKSNFKKILQPNSKTAAIIFIFFIIVLGGAVWARLVLMNPDRVLSDMLRGSLRTTGISKHVTQDDMQGKIHQKTYLSFLAQPRIQTVTTLSQSNQLGQSSSVTSETIGSLDNDFVRYIDIKIPSKPAVQEGPNSVLNIWAKREKNEQTDQMPTFLNEGAFAIVPFGNLTAGQADEIMKIIRDKQVYSWQDAELAFEKNRPVYVYDMSIKPAGLVEILSVYARDTGIGDQNQLDPRNYQGNPPVKVKITIDILSRQLTKISYQDTDRNEEFSGQGLRRAITEPQNTVNIFEFQRRLQSLQ